MVGTPVWSLQELRLSDKREVCCDASTSSCFDAARRMHIMYSRIRDACAIVVY